MSSVSVYSRSSITDILDTRTTEKFTTIKLSIFTLLLRLNNVNKILKPISKSYSTVLSVILNHVICYIIFSIPITKNVLV